MWISRLALLLLPACVPRDDDLPLDTDTRPSGSIDADADGVLAREDCDDRDPARGARVADRDCDGAPTAEDCDDTDRSLVALSVDPDCDGAPGCQAAPERVHPEDGATGVFYRRSGVIVTFQQDERPTGTISVRSADGAPAPGATTFSADGLVMTYTFTAPLTPSTTYITDIGFICGSHQTTFTTSATGAPVDGASLVGAVYEVDLLSPSPDDVLVPMDWSFFTMLVPEFIDRPLYLSPAAFDGAAFTTRLGMGTPGAPAPEQDLCHPAVDLPLLSAYGEAPYFTGTATDLELRLGEGFWFLRSLETSGAFTPDGSAIEGLRVDAVIDLGASTFQGYTGLCDWLSIFVGWGCELCDDGTPACYRFQAEGYLARRVDLAALQRVEPSDIAANPACEP